MRPTSSLPPLPIPKSILAFFSPSELHLLDSSSISPNGLPLLSQLHSRIIVSGRANDSLLSAKLIALYSHCRDVPSAATLFATHPARNVFLLNATARALSSNGLHQQAIRLFLSERNNATAPSPDSYTFSCLLKASASAPDLLRHGRNIHQLAVACGLDSDIFVANSLIAMYAKCANLDDSVRVFERMPERDIVSWNSMVSAFALNGFGSDATETMREMVSSGGLRPDHSTLVSVLSMGGVDEATVRELHCFSLRDGRECVPQVWNALISAYGKCGLPKEARTVFDCLVRKDRVSWNAMIACYAQNGLAGESLQLVSNMKLSGFEADVVTYCGIISCLSQNDLSSDAMSVFEELLAVGLKPDVVAIASILPSVSEILCLDYCKEIHAYSYRNGFEPDRRVRNALVSVYSRCGSIRDSEKVFGAIGNRDVISWSSMVAGFTQNGCFAEALDTFRRMVKAEVEPNPITVASMLSACAGLSALGLGREVHSWARRRGLDRQPFVGSALIDMYAKSGRIGDGRRVFDTMIEKNVVTWNSMIGGYAAHGLGEDALELFRAMSDRADMVSFIAALSACSHRGLVEEGIQIFNSMEELGLCPREAHYACVVDLLGRAGRVEEALGVVTRMPVRPSSEMWGVLLGACRMYSNVEIAMFSAAQIIKSGSRNSGYYVLLSNILAESGRWGEVEATRDAMRDDFVKKGAGCSWIQIDKEVHSFAAAKERAQHPHWGTLSRLLNVLNQQIKGIWW